jgi:hypothetical protein
VAMSTPRAFVPRPRHRGVVSQEVDGETLLYVEATHQACCLNAPAVRIWALCDGVRTLEQIAESTSLESEVVAQAVRDFGEAGLLENRAELPRVPNLARRRMLGVGLAAIPLILMVTAPTAAHAGSPCTPNGAECGVGVPPCCNNNPCLGGGTC